MRKTIFAFLIAIAIGAGGLSLAQTKTASSPAGTWSGTWSGGSAGKFEVTIRREAARRFSASIIASPDRGDEYTVPVRSIESAGSKLSLKFMDPEGEIEATLHGVIEGATFKGEYIIRARATGAEVEKGAFTASRKSAARAPK
jgi:hypothetical protein